MTPPPYVAVVGPGEASPAQVEVAEEVGRGLAARGAVVVCGGLGGVMEAVCRGASEAGGVTVGLLPGGDRAAANPFVSVAVATGLGEARNALVVRAADVVVAVGGSWGTLSEIALALRTGKRVVGVDTWDLTPPGGAAAGGGVERAATAAEAVELALGGG